MPARPTTQHQPPPRPPRPSTAPRPTSNTASYTSQSYSSGPSQSPSGTQSQTQALPWTYPRGYYCSKCGNTGYKIKNGQSCKRCWRKFVHSAPAQNVKVTYNGYYPSSSAYVRPQGYGFPGTAQMGPPLTPAMQSIPGQPLMLRPGDPRIGGFMCGECRGSGRVRFLLDKEICPLCHGIGRVF